MGVCTKEGHAGIPCVVCYPKEWMIYYGVSPQVCPVCEGRGHHARGFYLDEGKSDYPTLPPTTKCRACDGSGLVMEKWDDGPGDELNQAVARGAKEVGG